MLSPTASPPALEPPARDRLLLPLDILFAPSRAFRTLAARPLWLPAFVILFIAGLGTAVLVAPALTHLSAIAPPAAGSAPRTAAEQAEAGRSILLAVAFEQAVVVPLITIGLTATSLTVVARFKGQPTSYSSYLALAANCQIPAALGSLVSGLGTRLRDPATFHDFRSVLIAVPDNLAVLSQGGNDRQVQFLGQFDVFSLWSYVLLAYGIVALSSVRLTTALALAFSLELCFALIFL